jgi:DNA polymerase-1
MEKIILVDGNNLLFRSYYATAYSGNFMKNSKGFPTNALYGFTNMINKIINEECPTYMIVAFDKGKTFRHEKYEQYKDGRIEMPDELKVQFPLAKELLTHMGIKYYECDNYEADDIIGTFAKYCDEEEDFIGTIVSSDKDLLQLISHDVDIKLLKQKDYIRYNEKSFKEAYGIEPINIIDLKALMGDSSDNIPGVKGIGEKTALKLLHDYKTLNGVYDNLDKLTPKMREKLENDKDNAYMSYDLATIYKEVPMEISIPDIKLKNKNSDKLNEMYKELEFYSFLKKEEKKVDNNIEVKIIENTSEINVQKDSAYYLEILGTNYHSSKILGMAIYNEDNSFYIPFEILEKKHDFLDKLKYTYDYKKNYVALKKHNINILNTNFDTMIAGYLLEYNIKEDISYLANSFNYNIPFYDEMYLKNKSKSLYEEEDIKKTAKAALLKAKFIYETKNIFEEKLKEEKLLDLFEEIEMPLSKVLGDMEYNGVLIDQNELNKLGEEFKIKIELLEQSIYNDAGEKFNISSPKQLGEILFDKLQLPHGKKNKSGYSTSIDVLNKLLGKHPIIEKIIEYRTINKLYTTYVEGLKNAICRDGKIHTIYTQTLTRTGRLSSIEPNLQNIPIRNEYGALIRKAFIPSENGIIMSGDYSQIELRILSHMANIDSLKKAFYDNIDIHTKTASDIFKIPTDLVDKKMRRIAKAVNFGIIYGISSFGLSENLHIRPKEAKEFIDSYLQTYPGVKQYMDDTIKKAYEDGYVRTLFNRKRTIGELQNKNYMIRQSGERIALNTPIQGTSADIIKKAMIEIAKKLEQEKMQTKMIIQVHDELVFDVPNNEKEKIEKIIKDIMENVCELSVPLNVEIAYGKNWREAK